MADPLPNPDEVPLATLCALAARADGPAAAELARDCAHVLRSALTVVCGRAHLARARAASFPGNERLTADLAAIEAAALSLAAQVDAAVAATGAQSPHAARES